MLWMTIKSCFFESNFYCFCCSRRVFSVLHNNSIIHSSIACSICQWWWFCERLRHRSPCQRILRHQGCHFDEQRYWTRWYWTCHCFNRFVITNCLENIQKVSLYLIKCFFFPSVQDPLGILFYVMPFFLAVARHWADCSTYSLPFPCNQITNVYMYRNKD